jgi:hypothetical protein
MEKITKSLLLEIEASDAFTSNISARAWINPDQSTAQGLIT